jgi:acyl-CoA synthetase (NDP forming)
MRTVAALAQFIPHPPSKKVKHNPSVAAEPLPDGPFDEAGAKKLLRTWKVPFVPERTATTAEEAALAAGELGFPVALKVLSPDLTHKSDIGGVALGLRNADEVSAAWTKMMRSVSAGAPKAKITGALVAPMVTGGVEIVLGVHREVFHDVVFRLAPIDKDGALAMISSIKGKTLLTGRRGRAPVDIDAIADALVALSEFSIQYANDVESVDINPFIALPKGGYAVDAVVVRRESQQ